MPKNKVGKHIQFYMDCMKNDCTMPISGVSTIKGGLCRAVDVGYLSKKIFELFSEGQNGFHYWADKDYDGKIFSMGDFYYRHEFNSLRQTIVLFMAAINNEL